MTNNIFFRSDILTLVCILCLTLSNCVSFTTHQTGRTLGLGYSSASVSLQGGSIEGDSLNLPLLNERSFVMGEYSKMLGIHKKIDVGVKVNSSFLIGGMIKWQMIGTQTSKFASSLGVDAMISPPFFHFALGTSLASYNSFHSKNNRFVFTLAPKYTLITFKYYGDSTLLSNRLLGYSIGVVMGKKNKFSIAFAQCGADKVSNIFRTAQFSLCYIMRTKTRNVSSVW